MALLSLYVFLLLIMVQVLESEGGPEPLPTCLGITSGDPLPEDIGTLCADEET